MPPLKNFLYFCHPTSRMATSTNEMIVDFL